jgi:hypothetical protein
VRNGFFPGRTAVLLNQLRAKGIIPTVDAPVFNQRGGSVPPGFSITLANPNQNTTGHLIYYTMDGSDPRLPGGGVSSSAVSYVSGSPIVLDSSRSIRARIKSGSEWSGLDEATFYLQVDYTPLAITEIHYNPRPSTASAATRMSSSLSS